MTKPKTDSGLVREAPPGPARSHAYDWEAIAADLRASPGDWFKVFDEDRVSLVTAIQIDGIKALRKADGFEVRTRNNRRFTDEAGKQRRVCTLYLRWVDPTPPTKTRRPRKKAASATNSDR